MIEDALINYRLNRTTHACNGKARFAGNIVHIGKKCNTVIASVRSSRRARPVSLLDALALLARGLTIACEACLSRRPTDRAIQSIIDQSVLNKRSALS